MQNFVVYNTPTIAHKGEANSFAAWDEYIAALGRSVYDVNCKDVYRAKHSEARQRYISVCDMQLFSLLADMES